MSGENLELSVTRLIDAPVETVWKPPNGRKNGGAPSHGRSRSSRRIGALADARPW